MTQQTTFTYELDEAQQNTLLAVMATGNYRPRQVPYSIFAVEGDGFNCTVYAKQRHGRRKCCIQGGKARDFVEFVLEPNVLGAATLGYESVIDPARDSPHAGSDESGKGDYFGPLVVACCYVDATLAPKLREIGVRDCKQMSNAQILAVGMRTRKLLGAERYAVVKFGNPKYNRCYARFRNINRMLAWAHGTCIEELLAKQPACPKVVVDQFARVPMKGADGEPATDAYGHVREDVAKSQAVLTRALKERGKRVEVEQRHRAESDIAVAAASVVAREVFLRDMTALFAAAGRKAEGAGATTVSDALMGSSDPRVRAFAEEMVRKHGPKWLMNNAKAHFQTTDKVLAACGFSRADLPPEGQVTSAVKNGAYGGGKNG